MKKQSKLAIEQSPYMPLKEFAEVFRVNETSIGRASGDFAILKFTKLGKRTLIYRESVEELRALIDKRAHTAGESLTRHRE